MDRWRSQWFPVVAAMALAWLVACAPAAAPTPTPTKPPPAAATPAAAPTKEASPASAAPSKPLDPIKLGSVHAVSGYAAFVGQPERDTVVMLEEKLNREGGINGRPLKFFYDDEASDETKGVLAVKRLITQEGVLGFVGSGTSGIAMAEAPIVEDAKVPMVSMASARAVVLPDRKWVFKMPISEIIHIERIYAVLKERGIKDFAFLNGAQGSGREALKYLEQTVSKNGLTIAAKEEYGPTDTDMRPQLTRIKASGAKGLVVYGAEAAGAMAIRQAFETGITGPIVGVTSLLTAGIMGIKELREGMEGALFVTYKPDIWDQLPDTDPQKKVNADLQSLVKAKYNRPSTTFEAVAYDAFAVMVNALRKANPDPANVAEARSKIRDALEQTKDYVGAQSLLTYTPTEHEGLPRPEMMVTVQLKDGKLNLIRGSQ